MDIKRDGIVNSADFFAFTSLFLASNSSADINLDGVVNSQDMMDFLTEFFAGC